MAHIEELTHTAEVLDSYPNCKVLRRMPANELEIVAPQGGEKLRIAVVDTETTGLIYGQDKIIELGAVILEVDPDTARCIGVIDAYEEFENLGFSMPPESTAIHGIKDADVAGTVRFSARGRSDAVQAAAYGPQGGLR